jgi:predicted dehydrogenase
MPVPKPAKQFNVGMVGYGWVAGAHIAAVNATTLGRVTSVCSSRKLDAAELSARHGSRITCFTDLEEMLQQPELDVISICSYPYEHARQAVVCARAGKHLILEKPLALSWDDCCSIERAVAKAGVKACVCFECRFSGQFLTIKSMLDRGLLGHVHYGEVDYYHGIGPWYGQFRWNKRREAGGSSLLSAGCHALDALLLCLGSEVESVCSHATGSRNQVLAQYEYPSTSVTILKFKDGRVGKCASSIDCLQPYYFHTHLIGSEGSLLDNKFHSTRIAGLNKQKWSELAMKLLDSGDVSDHPYQTQFETFFQALKRDKEMPLTSLREAIQTHKVIFAADRSAQTGHPVRVGSR